MLPIWANAMSEQGQSVLPALESFLARVKDDLGQLRTGQQHAMLLIAVDPRRDSAESGLGDSLERQLLDELPTKAGACSLHSSKMAVWLPRCTHDEALALARLLRASVTRAGQRQNARAGVLTSIDPAERIPCALGLVFANQNNWDADALLRTAEITAALALVGNADSIKVAEQLRRSVVPV